MHRPMYMALEVYTYTHTPVLHIYTHMEHIFMSLNPHRMTVHAFCMFSVCPIITHHTHMFRRACVSEVCVTTWFFFRCDRSILHQNTSLRPRFIHWTSYYNGQLAKTLTYMYSNCPGVCGCVKHIKHIKHFSIIHTYIFYETLANLAMYCIYKAGVGTKQKLYNRHKNPQTIKSVLKRESYKTL